MFLGAMSLLELQRNSASRWYFSTTLFSITSVYFTKMSGIYSVSNNFKNLKSLCSSLSNLQRPQRYSLTISQVLVSQLYIFQLAQVMTKGGDLPNEPLTNRYNLQGQFCRRIYSRENQLMFSCLFFQEIFFLKVLSSEVVQVSPLAMMGIMLTFDSIFFMMVHSLGLIHGPEMKKRQQWILSSFKLFVLMFPFPLVLLWAFGPFLEELNLLSNLSMIIFQMSEIQVSMSSSQKPGKSMRVISQELFQFDEEY